MISASREGTDKPAIGFPGMTTRSWPLGLREQVGGQRAGPRFDLKSLEQGIVGVLDDYRFVRSVGHRVAGEILHPGRFRECRKLCDEASGSLVDAPHLVTWRSAHIERAFGAHHHATNLFVGLLLGVLRLDGLDQLTQWRILRIELGSERESIDTARFVLAEVERVGFGIVGQAIDDI